MMTTRPPTAETAVADGCRQTDKSAVRLLGYMLPGVRREKETVFLARYILREITICK